jgi:signal peptidase II
MKKRDWSYVVGALLGTWGLDFVTKFWAQHALSLNQITFHGPIGFVLFFNRGTIFGTFSNLPAILRVVSLSTSGAFLIFIYGSIQYLLPSRSLQLRLGMSFLLGGILGNVTDRIVMGQVVDFIVLTAASQVTPVFNLADAIQWVGYALVVYGFIRDGSLFWPDINLRKSIWVDHAFQIKFCLNLVAMGFCFTMINGVFAYTFLKVTIDELVVGPPGQMEDRFLLPFVVTYSVVSTGFMFALFVLGRILSHRMAGPVYSFENYIRGILSGKDGKFRVRQGDEFRHLEDLADQLRPLATDRTFVTKKGRRMTRGKFKVIKN